MAIDINLNDVQVKPIVVNADLTAGLDRAYNVVASAIFTDPAPTEGKGFIVFVRKGTATVGGVGYSTAGTVIRRIYHSGAWANYTGTSVDVNTIGVAINGAASATPNDTDLVMSVDTSVAKKNTWTQIKAFLKTYFDTVYTTTSAVASQITTAISGKEDASNKSSSYTASSTTTYANTKALVDGLSTKTSFVSLKGLNFSPVDASNYYFVDAEAPNTNATLYRFYVPSNIIIKKAYVYFVVTTTTASSETSSIYIRVDNTTDTLISNAVQPSSTNTVVSNTSFNLSVNAGSYFNIKWTTPTWATNPTNVQINVILEIANA